jgi:hypothetical protein
LSVGIKLCVCNWRPCQFTNTKLWISFFKQLHVKGKWKCSVQWFVLADVIQHWTKAQLQQFHFMISISNEYAVVDKSQFQTFCTLGCHATRCHSSFKLLIFWYNFYTNLPICPCLCCEYCSNIYEQSENFLWMKHIMSANTGDP